MVVAIVEDRTFQIDRYVDNTVDYAKVGDHYYSDKAPGAAFLGVPIYAGLKLVLDTPVVSNLSHWLTTNSAFDATMRRDGSGVSEQKVRFAVAQVTLAIALAAVPSAILGVLMYGLLGQILPQVWPRLGVVLAYGLLTPAFAYAGALYGHQLSAALLFGAFYLLFTGRKKLTPKRLFLVGLLLGYSVVTEYPAVPIVGLLFLYALYVLYGRGERQSIIWVVAGGALVGVGLIAYNNAVFGSPLNFGYQYSELWQEQHQAGFMSLVAPRGEALWGITFSAFRGLFVLSPWLLLILPGLVLWWRSGLWRSEWMVLCISSITMILFNISSIMWWGGFSIGPRYLLPVLPFMALPSVFVFQAWGRRLWGRLLIAGLLAWSIVATWGLTLAAQAFAPDTIANPLVEYAWPNWKVGNIARNIGTFLGLSGLWSLVPLVIALSALGISWFLLVRKPETSFLPHTSGFGQPATEEAQR
jgi:hypothetical protein